MKTANKSPKRNITHKMAELIKKAIKKAIKKTIKKVIKKALERAEGTITNKYFLTISRLHFFHT